MKNSIENSTLYKRNLKIHKNLWKVYTITLIFAFIVIYTNGVN